jgi:hypothetical protein
VAAQTEITMNRTLAAFGAAMIAFCGCDFVWLEFVAGDYYQAQIGSLMLALPYWIAAATFYPLYTGGIVFFCADPRRARFVDAGSISVLPRSGRVRNLRPHQPGDAQGLADGRRRHRCRLGNVRQRRRRYRRISAARALNARASDVQSRVASVLLWARVFAAAPIWLAAVRMNSDPQGTATRPLARSSCVCCVTV